MNGNLSARAELLAGDWRDCLSDVGSVDAVICDPPYGARTHRGNAHVSRMLDVRRDLTYGCWSEADVAEFVESWAPRCSGWFACMTSDDLIPAWRAAYAAAGLYDFAPVVVIAPRVRLVGDGPASSAVYLMVARPRKRAFMSWGALPGYYMAGIDRSGHIGGKPLPLMRAIVRHYSRRDDLIVDPCAGYATTLRAAQVEGRRSVGAEVDAETYKAGAARIAEPFALPLVDAIAGTQTGLFGDDE